MNSTIVSGLFSLLSPGGPRGRLTVLLFHKVPEVADPLAPTELCLDRFEHILEFIAATSNVLPLGEATDALARDSLPNRAVALTFDDGYAEWIETVGPALRKRNLPATFFVTTEQLSGPALWHERILAAVRALPDHGISLPYGFGSYGDLSAPQSRIRLVAELQERLKYAPLKERLTAIELLETQARTAIILPRPFDAASVRELHSQGFEVGAHTIRHPILNECTDEQAKAEIGGCKEELEAIIGDTVNLFAYPNGRPLKDYSAKHVGMVKSCGYKAAVATSGGTATSSSDIYQLARFSPWDINDTHIAYQLARNFFTREKHVPLIPAANGVDQGEVKCLLVASTFPPIHGGSAVVYENLCEKLPLESIRVLTAKRNYLNNQEIEGWQQHDSTAAFPVDRISLLRPLMAPPPANTLVSLYRLVFQDLPLYARMLMTAALLVYRHRINVVCIGELVTGSWLGIALKKIFGCKLVIYVHGEEITTATGGRLHGNKRRHYLAAADKVVAVSSFTCDALTQSMGLNPAAITLIQNGVDTDRFTPGIKDYGLLAKHQLYEKKIVLTVGRLVLRKGIDMAIKSMARVVTEMPHIHYLIVGDGECRSEFESLIYKEGLSDHVTLVGKVSDEELVQYFRTCDVFLMPNRTMPDGDTEGFGLVFREANACGKPVIGGRAGGAVEAVVDGKTGFLVDGTNPETIATTIIELLRTPQLAENMGRNGLQLALENNTKSVANLFLKTCERLLRENPNRLM
ncbi:glycosyltransferase [Noviherbaspirillum sedimenti]|uniref:Glycosyltransferase n=1 Tax=Noviherbaspirillum sedimenti TaxID=2320865 RepID=A0A3A3G1Z4_9BURK|nr:glycosyltransferase [Noviherbaspirillum sedimenti]RJG01894.1 glycosyltransferase [Noviherbaspirillum sedimenti]